MESLFFFYIICLEVWEQFAFPSKTKQTFHYDMQWHFGLDWELALPVGLLMFVDFEDI